MALLRGMIKCSENFVWLKNCPITLRNNLNIELLFSGKKVDIPQPPKKPLTSYMIYCRENRKDLVKKNPSLTTPQQIKQLAVQWNKLSDEMKKPYEVSARDCTLMYGEAHKKYYENLTPEQKKEIVRLKAEKREHRRLLRIKKALRESGVPKFNGAAYSFFVQSESKGKSIKQAPVFMKECAEKWKTLTDNEKKKFTEQAHADKVRFTTELEKWKRKMIAEGKEKLVKEYEELKKRGKSLDIEDISSTSLETKNNMK